MDNVASAALSWIVKDMLPFSILDSSAFKSFIQTINPMIRVPCSSTIKGKLPGKVSLLKVVMREHLLNTLVNGAITIDSWTSSANKPYLGITLHWLDDNFYMHETVLDLSPQPYPHDATTTARLISMLRIETLVDTCILYLTKMFLFYILQEKS